MTEKILKTLNDDLIIICIFVNTLESMKSNFSKYFVLYFHILIIYSFVTCRFKMHLIIIIITTNDSLFELFENSAYCAEKKRMKEHKKTRAWPKYL